MGTRATWFFAQTHASTYLSAFCCHAGLLCSCEPPVIPRHSIYDRHTVATEGMRVVRRSLARSSADGFLPTRRDLRQFCLRVVGGRSMNCVGPAIDMERKTNDESERSIAAKCHTHGAWCPRLKVGTGREQGTLSTRPTSAKSTTSQRAKRSKRGPERMSTNRLRTDKACNTEALNRTFRTTSSSR